MERRRGRSTFERSRSQRVLRTIYNNRRLLTWGASALMNRQAFGPLSEYLRGKKPRLRGSRSLSPIPTVSDDPHNLTVISGTSTDSGGMNTTRVGDATNSVRLRRVIHVSRKRSLPTRDVKEAFKLYRPISVQGNAFNNDQGFVASGTVAQSYVNGTSGYFQTTETNTALGFGWTFLRNNSQWNDTNNGQNVNIGLRDPGYVTPGVGTITKSLLQQAVADSVGQTEFYNGPVNFDIAGNKSFQYLLGPQQNTVEVTNMNPYSVECEIYYLVPRWETMNNFDPYDIWNSALTEEATGQAFFPASNIKDWSSKPTHCKNFNDQYKVVTKKRFILGAGATLDSVYISKGWKKITYEMLTQGNCSKSLTYTVMFRFRGASGFNTGGGEILDGMCDLPMQIGYRLTESFKVLPCPPVISKIVRMSTQRDTIPLSDIQFWNNDKGAPSHVSALNATSTARMGTTL